MDPLDYPWHEQSDPRIRLIHSAIEEIDPGNTPMVDFIVSFNVIEHLLNPQVALNNMTRILRSDGMMVHRVDFGPHDLWRTNANPLAFLAPSSALWSLMGSRRGNPNRVRHAQLLMMLEGCGLLTTDRVTRRCSTEDVMAIRPALACDFSKLSDDDLQVLDAEIASVRTHRPVLGRSFREGSAAD